MKFPVYVPFLCSLRPFQIIHWNSSPLSRSKEIAHFKGPSPFPGPEEVQLMNIPPQDILLLLKAMLSANPPHPPPAPLPHPNHCTIDYYPALPLTRKHSILWSIVPLAMFHCCWILFKVNENRDENSKCAPGLCVLVRRYLHLSTQYEVALPPLKNDDYHVWWWCQLFSS